MSEYSLLDTPGGAALLRREGDQNVLVADGLRPDEAQKALKRLNRGEGLKVGEVFEWGAIGALIAASFLWAGLLLALLAIGLCLAYEAQCYATARLSLPRLRVPHPHLIIALKGLRKSKAA